MNECHAMEGKVAVVTGAGGGIGREVALQLAAQGARVVVNDIGTSVDGQGLDAGPADRVVSEIRAAGGEAISNTDSVSDWKSAHQIVAAALDTFGQIDAVVNNAGILRDRFVFKMTSEEWQSVLDVHLNGSFFVSRAAADHFKAQQSGAFVHMTSTSGLFGNFGQANYAAAKAGIAGLSRAIAFDMQRYNVRSNCIAPFAWSRMGATIKADTPEKQEWLDRGKAVAKPSRIAPMIVFLASDLAHDVNGQIFATRANEIFLMSQPRPIWGMHDPEGWSPHTIANRVIPAMRSSFTPLENASTVFSWDAV